MFKTILSQVKEYKRPAFVTPIFMLLEVAMEMVIPLLVASIIDNGINKGDMGHVLPTGGLMVLAAGVGLFGGVMGSIFGAKASAGFAKNLRFAMYEKIQAFSFGDIDGFSQASLITRMTTDVTNIQNAFQMALRLGTRAPASLIVAMIMSISISGRLSVIFLAAMGFLLVVILILLLNMKKIFSVIFARYDALNESVRENVRGIRVVKAYVREEQEKSRFMEATAGIWRMFIKVEGIMASVMPIIMGTVYAVIILLSWFGGREVIYGDLTTGALTSLFSYAMNILISLIMFAAVFGMIAMSMPAMKRISEVLTHDPSIKNPANPVMEVADGSIEFKNVDFGYFKEADEFVLKNVNLSIAAGETIGIIGGTGSAKSSLVNLISRLYDVTNGEVLIGGRDVRDYDLEVLRNEVSVVLQKNTLFSGTILENLRWGDPNATLEDCQRACRLACAEEFIEKFPEKYETYIEQEGTNVSGGQRQRLCIARALLKHPKVLILDDSTSAVDTRTDAAIRRSFREEIPHITKIIISQRISSVMDADRIVVMDDGRISGVGTHEELLETNEIYKDVYETQTSGDNADFDE